MDRSRAQHTMPFVILGPIKRECLDALGASRTQHGGLMNGTVGFKGVAEVVD
jgi:hypothetical protein